MKGVKIELGSDRVLGIPLDTYIPSEQVAIEVNSGSEDMEILKEHLCQQRGIKRSKLPMKPMKQKSLMLSVSKQPFKVYIYLLLPIRKKMSGLSETYLRTGGTANERKEISYLLNSRRTEQSYSVTYPAEK